MIQPGAFYPLSYEALWRHVPRDIRTQCAKGGIAKTCKGVWNGEKRPPKKGEFYLSGAFIEVHCAPADLTEPMHIARLVRTKHVEVLDKEFK